MKALKVKKLDEAVKAARKLEMPIIVGTEMNKLGLPFVDNFASDSLMPYTKDFIDGAYIFHALLGRKANMSYSSAWANEFLEMIQKQKTISTCQ